MAVPARELLIETAERMFAEPGIHGVYLCEIGLAAGERTSGDKAGLVVAIVERRSADVNARWLELMDAALTGL